MANSIERFQKIVSEAHQAINTGYDQAIQNYQAQKNAFFQQLNFESEEAMNETFQEINNQIYNESNEELDEIMNNIFDKIKDYFEEFVVKTLEGHPDDLTIIKNRLDTYRSNKDPHYQMKFLARDLKTDIEKSLEKDGINRLELIKYLQKSGISLGGETNKSLQDNLFGYLRRLIVQRYTSNESIKNMTINLKTYKNSLKGYLQEEAIEIAFQKVFAKYGYSAKQTGAIESDTNQEIIYDLVLGPKKIESFNNSQLRSLVKQMDSTQNITESGESSLPEDVFLGGIQSKSWENPAIGNPKFISFGIHSSLLPQNDEKYFWHGGVKSLMSRMSDVIGRNNFLFATGTELQFTVDLLTQLRERSYVLNFHKPKDQAISNPHVYADIHNDK